MKSKLELKKRDLSLFSYLHSCKIASTNQINRDQFKRSLVTTRKRLAKLREHGLIDHVFKGIENSKPNAYSLTPAGFGYLKKY
ncbi:MAG: replication-relaxation family protein, partial [Bacteriovoracaceae bacterium]|nr:replication-relaxation family protein [Bacteriovoracaceae bacterium]